MWRKGRFRRFASLPTRKNSQESKEKHRATPMEKDAAFPNDAPTGWGGTQMLQGSYTVRLRLCRSSVQCRTHGATKNDLEPLCLRGVSRCASSGLYSFSSLRFTIGNVSI